MRFAQLRSLLTPPFRGFFFGRLVSLLGSSMTPVALALAVLNASGRPTDLGIVMACQIIPQLALLLVGGAVGDRVPRRTALCAANLGAGLTQGALAVLLITSHYGLLPVAGLAAVNGAFEAFASPALRGIVPEIVASENLRRANSLLAAARNATGILGPTAAGLIVVGAGGGWAIAVDALRFIVAAYFFAQLPVTAAIPAGRTRLLRDIRQGWHTFRAIPWVYTMALSFSALNLVNVGPWQILGPMLTKERSGEASWGVVLSVRAIGLLVMSVVMYRLILKYPLRSGSLIGVLGALPLLALGLGTPWLAVFAFVGALGFTTAGITWDTSLQRHIPRHMLSRIASFDDLLSYAPIPVGELLVGPAASSFGPKNVMLFCGIAYVIVTLAPLSTRSVRDLPATPPARQSEGSA